jgi:Phage capsid family
VGAGHGSIAGAPATSIVGRPLFLSEHLPAIGDAGDLVVCDPTLYLLGDRQQIILDASPHVRFESDQTVFRASARLDGQPIYDAVLTPKNGPTAGWLVQIATRSLRNLSLGRGRGTGESPAGDGRRGFGTGPIVLSGRQAVSARNNRGSQHGLSLARDLAPTSQHPRPRRVARTPGAWEAVLAAQRGYCGGGCVGFPCRMRSRKPAVAVSRSSLTRKSRT